jgi:TRAP-type C4-dicarboxylate transport system substrate-binding protein
VVPVNNTFYQTVLPGDETIAATGAVLESVLVDCPECLEELSDRNMIMLAGWDTSPYMLGCTSEVASVSDMMGKKVRAAGGTVRLMEAAGAVPVAATLVEAINLLQTGAIDCVFGTAGWYRSFGYADFVKYHTAFPMGMTGPAAGWIMNRDAWDQLDDAAKTVHLQKGAMVSAMQALGQFVQEETSTLEWAVNEKGVTVVDPEASGFESLMTEFVAAQDAAVIEASTAAGVEDPLAKITIYRENFDKWKGLTEGVDDIDALTQLYWDEIFSKIDPATY